jgi:hypothetical protein
MFRGFGFAVPAVFVSACTICFGGFFAAFAWCIAFFGSSEDSRLRRFPTELYTFSASVASVAVGMAIVSIFPESWEQYRIWGSRLIPAVYLIFIAISFLAAIITAVLLSRRPGHTRGILAIGSFVLIGVHVLGIIGYIMALPGMPLH